MLRKSLESHTEPGSDVEPSLDSFSGDLTSAKSTTSDNVLKNTQFIHGRRATRECIRITLRNCRELKCSFLPKNE
ncbi:hypothetical protein AX774_g7302 [Zancudomyces culisetae]|uniref:Uncharacterized protein n=1 Tax=Zancudomyces culisetae TaxID=1213189 RepID=A0A1R1PEF9_ZANCU|nr:hypothetical protein AX774_g7302 [Zancudomyces culisetae]|eukprot:OMH79293.1 hypothetical protein AX774_g7302 [Zancudomyces culisetae]